MSATPTKSVSVLPIVDQVDRLQSEGHNVWIHSVSADMRRVLVVAGADVSVASVYACNGVGRYECSTQHLLNHGDVYAERFPVSAAELIDP